MSDRTADPAWGRLTRAWVQGHLEPDERITDVVVLRGGWTSEMRRLCVSGPAGERSLVLRSIVHPHFAERAEELLMREAEALGLLMATDVPVARLIAVDAQAARCDHPSLLSTMLPGAVRFEDQGAEARADRLAEALVRIHRVGVSAQARPRRFEAWASPASVESPAGTARPQIWRQAVEIIGAPAPEYVACLLHRDYHPGNVLFDLFADGLRVSGVVDWVETSWGPADLDVAHCSTNLALLHGVPAGMAFPERYRQAGGVLTEEPSAQLYWRLLDALAFAPHAENVAAPWRALGRTDLTDERVAARLEDYIATLVETYAQRPATRFAHPRQPLP